jgi:hypothetical protein
MLFLIYTPKQINFVSCSVGLPYIANLTLIGFLNAVSNSILSTAAFMLYLLQLALNF